MGLEGLVKVTKIYGRGRTQIPAEVMKALGLKEGDKVAWFIMDSETAYIKPISSSHVRRGKYL